MLILDEAHRLRATSESRYTRAELRTGTPQVDELIAAARVPVFLLDQHQVVRPGEMGTVEEIVKHAESAGLDTLHIPLDAQFRCGGSEKFIGWVEQLLGLRDGGPVRWEPDPPFQLDVVETPFELEGRLSAFQSQGYGARMAAGYCWPWSDPRADGTLVADVQIGDWARPWNLRGDRGLPGAPPAALWASDDGGFDQVGCVYTAQGFEYDWNGVILGPDLVWRTDRWVSRREFNWDPDFRSRKTVSDESSTGWCGTSTKCCSPGEWSGRCCTRSTRRPERCCVRWCRRPRSRERENEVAIKRPLRRRPQRGRRVGVFAGAR